MISAKTHHHKGDFNIFEGMKVKGNADVTICRGKVVWKDGKLTTEKGSGKFVKRQPYGYPFERITVLEKLRNEFEVPVDRTKPDETYL